MTIRLDETLLRAETLFLQFQRMVAAIDRKRLESEEGISQDSDSNEGIRRRKGKEPEINSNDDDNGGEGSSSSATTKKLPIVSDLLRELLNKELPQS